MRHQLVAMHQHFKPAARGQTRRRADHRHRAIFQQLDRLLEVIQKGVHCRPVPGADKSQKPVQIHPGREMLGIIMNDDAAARIRGGQADHLHGLAGQRVRLGMKFNQPQIAGQPV